MQCKRDHPSKCEVAVLFKSGHALDVGNYRRISVLSPISRVNEEAALSRVEQYYIDFFYECQYGFKKDRDAQGAIFDLVTSLQTALDTGKKCATIFIDLRNCGSLNFATQT